MAPTVRLECHGLLYAYKMEFSCTVILNASEESNYDSGNYRSFTSFRMTNQSRFN